MTDTSPVESVDRALLVLQSLARAGSRGSSLSELATSLGLHKTTVHRALAALRFREFVAQDPSSGDYVLGPSATRLAEDFFSDDNLPVLLHAALVALCATTGELVHLGVLVGAQVVYLDKVEPERSVRVWSAIGHRSPALTTALGRALLAFRGADRTMLRGYVPASGPGADVDVERLGEMMTEARAAGYATEDEENEAGISCVAVPLLRSGSAIAAVSVTAPAERMTTQRITWLHEQMREVLPPLLADGLSLPG